MAKAKKQIKQTEPKIPKYMDFNINLDGEIHIMLESLKEHINTREIDLESANELIIENLNEVISEMIFNHLNEDLLVRSVINYKEVA